MTTEERWLKLLAEELSDVKINLMDVARSTIQLRALGYGYKAGTSELAAILRWLRAYEQGTARYEEGCNLLHDGNAVYNRFVDRLVALDYATRKS